MARQTRCRARRTRFTRKRGGASVGQPLSFFRGGFVPSVMGGLVSKASYLSTSAIAQGVRLLWNDKKRMSKRRRTRRS
jgi:hypothetical protein